MNQSTEGLTRREVWLRREIVLWRLLLILCAAGVMIAAAAPQSEKEIHLKSADGKNTVVLSAEGLSLERNGSRLAQLTFETVGDGEQQVAFLKISGAMKVESGIIEVGSLLKRNTAIRPEGLTLVDGGTVRATLNAGTLSLLDKSGQTRADLTVDDRGLAGLSLAHDQKVIAQLASTGRFGGAKRDSASLVLNDWGTTFTSHLITASEDKTQEHSREPKN